MVFLDEIVEIKGIQWARFLGDFVTLSLNGNKSYLMLLRLLSRKYIQVKTLWNKTIIVYTKISLLLVQLWYASINLDSATFEYIYFHGDFKKNIWRFIKVLLKLNFTSNFMVVYAKLRNLRSSRSIMAIRYA